MKPLLLTFDLEELDQGQSPAAAQTDHQELAALTREGTRLVLDLLAARDLRCTFFVTARVASELAGTVREIARAGHEIACHGFAHSDNYRRLPPGDAIKVLREARVLLEDVSGREVVGLRTPRLLPCPAAVSGAAGFRYDASPHPTWVPGRYCRLALPRRPWRDGAVLIVPISVTPVLRLPVSWYTLQLAGAPLTLRLARLALHGAPYLHLYFHVWEAAELPTGLRPHRLVRHCGRAWVERLGRLLSGLEGRVRPLTIGEFLTG